MKTLIIYYSYTGSTRKKALEAAAAEGADVFEVTDLSRPGKVGAYVGGCFRSMRGKAAPIHPITVDLGAYGRIVIMAPVWAGYPAPPINNVFAQLPQGAEVEVALVSASGKSSARQRVTDLVESKGCRLTAWRDIKS